MLIGLTPQCSGRVLRCAAQRVCTMQCRTCAVSAPPYSGPLQLFVKRHTVSASKNPPALREHRGTNRADFVWLKETTVELIEPRHSMKVQ
jgi:hypothetical protein